MKSLSVLLNTDEGQRQRLGALQLAFAQVCNALAPVVRDTRCWNRVALHHMTYKTLRAQFPALGSQMVCNAIYSVCRASRLVYQGADSPFNVQRWGAKPLPLLRFANSCPVYFDRHTLSIKGGNLSMYTLDGRMKFSIDLGPGVEAELVQSRFHEIVLSSRADGQFQLSFLFNAAESASDDLSVSDPAPALEKSVQASGELPEYLLLENLNDQSL